MITVIIPVHNEQDNIETLLKEISAAAHTALISEVIYIDDGSTDKTLETLENMRKEMPMLRIIKHSVRAGQSAAFMSGIRAAGNSLIVLMDGDGQNDPKDIAALHDCYKHHSTQYEKIMITGQRVKRHDNVIRRISSRLANKIRSSVLKDQIRDTGCSLKLIRREDYLRLPYFDHMHRFLPALLMRDHVKILTVDVSHRPRDRGTSKYGFWDRLWVGIIDLIGARWLLSRGTADNFKTQEIL